MADAQGKFVAAEPLFDDLPSGWLSVRVGDLLPLQYGKSLPVRERKVAGAVPVFGSSGIVGSHDEALCPANSILVGRKGSAGSVHFSKVPSWPIDTAYYVTPHRELCAEYWFHQLKFLNLGRLDQSTAIPSLSRDSYSPIRVSVPPAAEQRRIVSRIDELFSRIEAGERAIAAARAGLKRYRKSILKAAVTGALTADWRPSAQTDSDLPANWRLATAEQLTTVITKGTTPVAHAMAKGSGEIPYIKVYNLGFDGRVDFTINPTFIPREVHDRNLARSKLYPGDVLMNIVGPPLGQVAVVPSTFPEWNTNQAVALFRPTQEVLSSFLALVLLCDATLRWALERAKASVGQVNLTLEICRSIPVPLPPLAEQAEIVSRVEAALSRADHAEATFDAQISNARALKQSILKTAFAGRLMPQDPCDEPATDMLARIADEPTAPKFKTKARA